MERLQLANVCTLDLHPLCKMLRRPAAEKDPLPQIIKATYFLLLLPANFCTGNLKVYLQQLVLHTCSYTLLPLPLQNALLNGRARIIGLDSLYLLEASCNKDQKRLLRSAQLERGSEFSHTQPGANKAHESPASKPMLCLPSIHFRCSKPFRFHRIGTQPKQWSLCCLRMETQSYL